MKKNNWNLVKRTDLNLEHDIYSFENDKGQMLSVIGEPEVKNKTKEYSFNNQKFYGATGFNEYGYALVAAGYVVNERENEYSRIKRNVKIHCWLAITTKGNIAHQFVGKEQPVVIGDIYVGTNKQGLLTVFDTATGKVSVCEDSKTIEKIQNLITLSLKYTKKFEEAKNKELASHIKDEIYNQTV